jgi:hypothetical protein
MRDIYLQHTARPEAMHRPPTMPAPSTALTVFLPQTEIGRRELWHPPPVMGLFHDEQKSPNHKADCKTIPFVRYLHLSSLGDNSVTKGLTEMVTSESTRSLQLQR